MKLKYILLTLLATLQPIIWWGIFMLLEPLRGKQEDGAGLEFACTCSCIFIIIFIISQVTTIKAPNIPNATE